MSNHLVKV